jgi:anionic cell wall polymer biosynthesis LytR-Cps2A-Psr (LCP) family protein
MKKNNPNSVDGFIPRRAGAQLGSLHEKEQEAPVNRALHTGDEISQESLGVARENKIVGRSDIDESLREIDDAESEKSTRRSRRAQRKHNKNVTKKPKNKALRIIKGVLWALLLAALVTGGYLAFKAINASDSVFKGNIFDLARHEPLKQDANGRSNFLILGTSEDDPGHQGADLTDSIMVVSMNQTTKDAFTFSIPRDLRVQYGQACVEGYSGKINSYFSCIDDGEDDAADQNRLSTMQAFVGEIIGMDIQYGVHVNYTVMRDVVNAIGGSITVNIESRDPRGQMDSNFNWKCGANYAARIQNCPPNGHFIDYPNGPAVLDAEHALYLAQARGDIAPTYGFEQSNFDRERNQQKILVAIRDKALATGTLTNIGAVTGLIDALGGNLRTNIETKEIQTLVGLAKDIPADKIVSIDLNKEGEAVFTGSAQPVAGEFEFDGLRAYLNKVITAEPFVKEEPHVMILNGGGVAGVAQTESAKLTAKGFVVDDIDNAPEGTYPQYTIYQIRADKPLTAAKLKALYGVEPQTTTPPVSVMGDTDFLIIIGPVQ